MQYNPFWGKGKLILINSVFIQDKCCKRMYTKINSVVFLLSGQNKFSFNFVSMRTTY